MQKKVYIHAGICSELNSLYERKNHDYGDSFGKSFAEYGMAMPCIRLEDKLNRLKALTRSAEQKVSDESIEDTLMDLANYAIMTLVERRKDATPSEDKSCARCVHHSAYKKPTESCKSCTDKSNWEARV